VQQNENECHSETVKAIGEEKRWWRDAEDTGAAGREAGWGCKRWYVGGWRCRSKQR
jgi:hypothetical protein